MTQARFRQRPTVIMRSIGDEVCAVAPEHGDFHCLSGTALTLWDLLGVPRTVPELVSIVSSIYRTEPGRIASDIDPWVDDLITKGLVEEVEENDI